MIDETLKLTRANEIARKYSLWAAGGGIIPLPGLDVAAITAVQLKMLAEIAELYQTRLSKHLLKSILTTLLTGIGVRAASVGALGSAVKAVPLVGTVLGMAAMPVTASAATYAVGNVFAAAFERKDTSLLEGSIATTKEELSAAILAAPV